MKLILLLHGSITTSHYHVHNLSLNKCLYKLSLSVMDSKITFLYLYLTALNIWLSKILSVQVKCRTQKSVKEKSHQYALTDTFVGLLNNWNDLMAPTGELAPPVSHHHEPTLNFHITVVDGNVSFAFSFSDFLDTKLKVVPPFGWKLDSQQTFLPPVSVAALTNRTTRHRN